MFSLSFQSFARALTPVPRCNNQGCIQLFHKNADCRRCVQACPSGAIKIGRPGTRIFLDTERCRGCERCIAACPLGIFKPSGPAPGARLATWLDRSSNGRLTCGCLQAAGRCVASIRCHGGHSVEDLLTLTAEGVRYLDLRKGDCANCPFGNGAQFLEQTLIRANHLLTSLSIDSIEVREISDRLSLLLPAPSHARPGNAKVSHHTVSRRALFSSLRRSFGKMAASTLPGQETDLFRTKLSNPAPRAGLYSALMRLGATDNEIRPALFPRQSLKKDRCKGCRLCQKLCRTKALGSSNSLKERVHSPGACVGCRLCETGCPRQAIRIHDPMTRRGYLSDSTCGKKNTG